MISESIQKKLHELEQFDAECRDNGLPEDVKRRWNVDVNVGPWVTGEETGRYLYDLILQNRPQTILELGTSIGYSTIWMAAAAKEYGGELLSIEREAFKIQDAEQHLQDVGLADHVWCRQGDILEELKRWDRMVDFVFIDAGKREYQLYILELLPWLTEGAIIVADDVIAMQKQLAAFLHFMHERDDFTMETVDVGHGLLIARKNRRN